MKKWALGSPPGGLAPKPCPVDEPPVCWTEFGEAFATTAWELGHDFLLQQKTYPSLKFTQFFLRNDVKESINMSRNHVVSKQRNLQPKKRYLFEKTFCCPFVPFDRFLELGPFLGQAKLLDLSSDQNPG